MKLQYTKAKPIRGCDQNLFPEDNHAFEIVNFRADENGGWLNDVGWEPLIPFDSTYSIASADFNKTFSPTRFLAIWRRHEGAEPYYLYERGGELRYDWGNKGLTTRDVVLKTDRIDPKPDNPGTQIAPFKNFALILNGVNAPIKFWGRELVEGFSWNAAPPTPTILTPQPNAVVVGTGEWIEGQHSAIWFDKTNYFGVGGGDNGDKNTYGYRVAWVTTTGSMSPLSEPFFVSWNITSAGAEGKQGVILTDVPIGPAGTSARLIFRTKNKGDGLSSQLDDYYLIAQINENVTTTWIDILPDSELSSVAVDLQDSSPISYGHKYAVAWDSCMWLAGGEAHPTRIIYSKANLPEQFPAFNYFDVGVRDGGHITALFPYYNALLVFRERSIDVVTKTPSGYQIAALDPFIGTVATNTIRFVPGLGVCFLTRDGVYAITGGLYGGSQYQAKNVSTGLSEEWKRLTLGALARATATYSDREKEYWVHYPTDGKTENERGSVYHTNTQGWSLRNSEDKTLGEMKFTHLATDGNGWIIIGTYQNRTSLNKTGTFGYPGIGLQVWSHAPHWGHVITYVSTTDGVFLYNVFNAARGDSKFISVWEDMGNIDIKKAVSEVLIDGLSQGNNKVDFKWFLDGDYVGTSETSSATQQNEYYNTSDSQTVMAASTEEPVAVWGTSIWEAPKRIVIRFDTGATQSSTFKFEISTSNYLHVLMYRLGYSTTDLKTINQKG